MPIEFNKILISAETIAKKAGSLVEKIIGRPLPLSYLTIFSHTSGEYDQLLKLAAPLGTQAETNNGIKFSLTTPLQTDYGPVHNMRIRKPDIYRPQMGCADFEVPDYQIFKNEELAKHPNNMRVIERPEYEMIEFYDFDNNEVLAYVVSN